MTPINNNQYQYFPRVSTKQQPTLFSKLIPNNTDNSREFLPNSITKKDLQYSKIINITKRISNQAILNESGEIKKSEKWGKSGQVGTM